MKSHKNETTYEKKITGDDLGCSIEALGVAYKAIGKSVINYGASIWAATLKNTN